MALQLPDFPWDSLIPFQQKAKEHPLGLLDLSVGSPVDEVPELVWQTLAKAPAAHSYPQTAGSSELRQAIIDWYRRRWGVSRLTEKNVMPTIGSKELVGTLAITLGLGENDVIVQPELAYPTYAIGAAMVGAKIVSTDNPEEWPENTKLIWLNSPGNPDGKIWSKAELKLRVDRARELGALLVNDECYLELGWKDKLHTVLDPEIVGDSFANVLSVYSLSKQSNLAGFRAAFIAGCSGQVQRILAVRKHLGLIPPAPVQSVMTALLADDEHVAKQKELYRGRRELLLEAFGSAGFEISKSEAGLYLWATTGKDCWQSVAELAERGILVTPGIFYGESGANHIRIALTVPDEKLATIQQRF